MKKNLVFILGTFIALGSCNEVVVKEDNILVPEEKNQGEEIEETRKPEVILEPNLDTLSKRSKDFFTWYKENRSDYYGFESKCCQLNAAGDWEVSKAGVDKFTKLLADSDFFSLSYINGVKATFVGDTYLTRQITELNNDGEENDGIPPYASEGDLFFNIQEEASEEMYNGLNHKSSQVFKEDSVAIDTGITTMIWVFEDGKWKLSDNS
jgi:hypothetical protein